MRNSIFFWLLGAFLIAPISALAGTVIYNFEEGPEDGIVVRGVPSSVIDGSLKIEIDENSQTWTASMLVTVEEDIFDNPVMDIRYKIGDPVNATAQFPVTLKIDDEYTNGSYSGSWRLYPSFSLSASDWQIVEVDLSPLINSWRANNSQEHGNVQEIMIFIGNNNGPFIASELYIDYIRIGDKLRVKSVEINPDDLHEVVVDIGVPVTASLQTTDFTVHIDGTSQNINDVFIHDESQLIVKLQNAINVPRNVMDLQSMELIYNGNSNINDSSGDVLAAFTEAISARAYAQNQWPYWGDVTYHNFPIEPEWFSKDTVLNVWDWSLPGFVEADEMAYFWYKNRPNLNFSSKNLNSVYVSWNELEPKQGEYNFELLRQRILDNAQGYDGVGLRLLASVWVIESYPEPGLDIPAWLAGRKNAPRWMDDLDIAKIPMNSVIDGKYKITNMDIMDPLYHELYVKFIDEFRKSGIPEMDELKVVNVCYRSGSTGEEFTSYNSQNNAIEAQYSAAVVEQRTKERLDVWANAFGENTRKLMWVGHTERAYISYAGELGMGSRQGFVEMYNGFVHMPQFGFTINSDRYVDVDEENHFIKNNPAFGDENEEYTNELRFSWRESFPYRYYVSSFRMLQQRRNYVMHDANTLNPELTWYVGLALSRKVENTPDAFAMLSEYNISQSNNGTAGPLKNIERWLYQRDMPGYETTPAMAVPTAKDFWYNDTSKPYDFTARKGQKIGFYMDDRLFPNGEQAMAIKVTFYDGVAGTLKLVYENNNGIQSASVVSNGEDALRTATFFINARAGDTNFDHNFDFLIESEEEVPVFFVRVIKTEESYINTDQLPYGGINHSIPGKIESEHYDVGDEGFAYQDDSMRHGDDTFRSDDFVDVIAKPGASKGYVVSYTNEGEWLEYTVDVETGYYDITLFYYCGETPGELLLTVNGEVIETFRGMENLGWETRSSITIEEVMVNGGKDKILRLEFVNGAGFEIDAIEFVKMEKPVTGVSISACPQDTLETGDDHTLIADVFPDNAYDSSVTWSSSDTIVASVDKDGHVTALTEGSVTIYVTTNDGNFVDSCVINVKEKVIPVIGLTISNCPSNIINTGTEIQLIANVAPANATDSTVMWSSSNTSVATVDDNGLVRAISQGSVTITATTNDGGFQRTCAIGVYTTVTNSSEIEPSHNGIKVYPNPVSEMLYFSFPDINAERRIRVFNAFGQKIYSDSAFNLHKSVEIENLKANGIIFVQVITGQNVSTFKIIIN